MAQKSNYEAIIMNQYNSISNDPIKSNILMQIPNKKFKIKDLKIKGVGATTLNKAIEVFYHLNYLEKTEKLYRNLRTYSYEFTGIGESAKNQLIADNQKNLNS